MEEQNLRLTTGSPAVYHRDRQRSFFLAADQWNDAFLSLLTLFMQCMSGKTKSHYITPVESTCPIQNHITLKHQIKSHHITPVESTCRTQTCLIHNPDTQLASRFGAAHGRAAGLGRAG